MTADKFTRRSTLAGIHAESVTFRFWAKQIGSVWGVRIPARGREVTFLEIYDPVGNFAASVGAGSAQQDVWREIVDSRWYAG